MPALNEDGSAVEVDANDDRLVTTDSSAGGTAILCGERTRYGYIGLDKNGKEIKRNVNTSFSNPGSIRSL